MYNFYILHVDVYAGKSVINEHLTTTDIKTKICRSPHEIQRHFKKIKIRSVIT